MNTIFKDCSVSAIVAGFIAVLVGFASSVAIVFQGAVAAGASPQQIESWVWALGLGMGISTLGLSVYYKRPLIIVWSTPGAALLAAGLQGASLEEAIGTFLFVGLLILIVGVSGLFNKIITLIPMPLASAMLAGILVQFGIDIFIAMEAQTTMVVLMFASYLVCKYWQPRYAILAVLVVGVVYCIVAGSLHASQIDFSLAKPQWVSPQFSISAIMGIGIPLFIVTMTSQNLPGVAILKSSGFAQQNVSPIISVTGLSTLLLAPFGGFTFNLAAITAAICTSDECHPIAEKRYIAGVSAGIFNIIAGILGATVVSLFAAFPQAMIAALAGLALLSTIANSLKAALADNHEKEAALITFLVSASGITFFGIAAAFWGIVIGMIVLKVSRKALQ